MRPPRKQPSLFLEVLSRLCRSLALAVLLAGASATTAHAQNRDEESRVRRFVDQMGETLYFLAWPTATYRKTHFGGIAQVPGGLDIKVVLRGISALDNSDLWTEVVLEFRNGQVTDMRWGRHNAQLFKPGETIAAFSKVLAELNRQYQLSNTNAALPPAERPTFPLAAVCIDNPTDSSIHYTINWSGSEDKRKLEPKSAYLYWSPDTNAEFAVTFDDSFEPGVTLRTFRLRGSAHPAKPSKCDDVEGYRFVISGQQIGLQPYRWLPGSAHPFAKAVVADTKNETWACAQGFKWLAPEDPKSLDCVSNSTGLVGLTLKLDPGDAFPTIVAVRPGGPAERAGLAAGQWLIGIGSASTQGRSLTDVIQMLRGDVGTVVKVAVTSQNNAPRIFNVGRE